MVWLLPGLLLAVGLATADQPAFFNDSAYDDGAYGPYPQRWYHSDASTSPRLNIIQPFTECDDGSYLFIAPRGNTAPPGPMILDARGDLIWTAGNYDNVYNFRVQQYRGESYLTFWTGDDSILGHGRGEYVMLNHEYAETRRFKAGNGLPGDLHEFLITADDTALVTVYNATYVDISALGEEYEKGYIWDSIFQEIDLETGEVLFQWSAYDTFDLKASYNKIGDFGPRAAPWDWYHINSVDKDPAGNYLISSRYLHHLACIDGSDGIVKWTIGGSDSDFTDVSGGLATSFKGQHDARWTDDYSAITLFDNQAINTLHYSNYSRGLRIGVDVDHYQVQLEASYIHPLELLGPSQGSMQTLPNGNILLGYGWSGAVTEFLSNGTAVCDARFEPLRSFEWGTFQSYRAMKFNWTATPPSPPNIVFVDGVIYFSWLGATEVRSWLIQDADVEDGNFANVWTVEKQGFESSVGIEATKKLRAHVRVVAQDAAGRDIKASAVLHLQAEEEKYQAHIMAQVQEAWGKMIGAASVCLGVASLLVVVGVVHGSRTTRRKIKELPGTTEDSGDEEERFPDTASVASQWLLEQPRNICRWATVEWQMYLERRHRLALRDEDLALSDTDISDDDSSDDGGERL